MTFQPEKIQMLNWIKYTKSKMKAAQEQSQRRNNSRGDAKVPSVFMLCKK